MTIFWTLLLGSLLSPVPLVKHTLLGPSSIAVSQMVRVASYGAALFMIWMLSFRTAREMVEDGQGVTFLRAILRPLTGFLVLFAASKVILGTEAINARV